ncbi:MAG: hypothetical protein PVG75_10320 [Thioalkalispiraceae bacterium]
MSITLLTILIVAAGFYFMYGSPFSTQQVDLQAYQELCNKYRNAQPGVYTDDQMQMLVSEINYIISDELKDIQDPASRELKLCAQVLSGKIAQ